MVITGVEILVYFGVFFSLYFAIFVLATFFENRSRVYKKEGGGFFPAVSLIVPCYNEEKNIEKALISLLNLKYPKKKLEIIVVDDGSKDNTFQKALTFSQKDERVKVFHKPNGGKYTALNYGLEKTNSLFIGTIDADSYLHPLSLRRIMKHFDTSAGSVSTLSHAERVDTSASSVSILSHTERIDSPKIMAVVATVKIAHPKNILEGVQYVEYLMGAFLRKVLSFLDSVNVVPGPLSVFRKEVFETLGPFRAGHQTEDLEIAFRMQKADYKIAHAIDAIVYTEACPTFRSLFSQRLRWKRGFLLNLKDNPELLNFKKHGNLAFLLCYSVIGGLICISLTTYFLWQISNFLWTKISHLILLDFDIIAHISSWRPDLFLLNIKPTFALGIISLATLLVYLFFSKKLTLDKGPSKKNILFYILLYAFLDATWWTSAIFSLLTKKELRWS